MPSYIIIIPANLNTVSAITPTNVKNRRQAIRSAVYGVLKVAAALVAIALKEAFL